MKTSVFTTVVRDEGRVFAETTHSFAFLANIPITPGHSLVAPRRIVATVDELAPEELTDLFALVKQVKTVLRQAVGAQGFNCAWNEGRAYGQSVPHLHIHIVPRTQGDAGITQYEPRQFLYRPGSRAESPTTELADLAQHMRKVVTDIKNNTQE